MKTHLLMLGLLAGAFSVSAMAQQPLNVPAPTFGGKQLWGDEYIYGGWRIQRNVLTNHCRLLDDKDVRRAWGTAEQCESALTEAKANGRAKLHAQKVCVLIHGYLRAKDSFTKMQHALEAAGFEVYAINYPSSQQNLETLCKQTGSLLARVSADFEQVNLVTHSMGGIIARDIVSKAALKGSGRVVMLGPPNHGARMADLLLSWWPSQYVAGPAGKQLTTSAETFVSKVGTPLSPFAVIAGARGDGAGYNPAIPGDDDSLVSVEETKLSGATAHHIVHSMHTFIMNNDDAIELTKTFLTEPQADGNLSK